MSPTVKHRLPEIMGVGPGRTGTTWLHRVLEGHVDLPYGVKEVLYFTLFYDKGIDWYARHFRYATGERKIAEICPYFFNPEARDRIKTDLPNCKIIITLREPVDRIYSVYKNRRRSGWLRAGTLDEVLKARPQLGGGHNYAFHLKAWFDTFGRENVLVTTYDELREQPQSYLDRVTDFAGVGRISLSARPEIGRDVHTSARAPKSDRLASNARRLKYWLQGHQAYGVSALFERAGVWDFCFGRGEVYPRLTPEQDARLHEQFLPEVEALEELLGIDLSAWKKPRAPRVIENSLRAG